MNQTVLCRFLLVTSLLLSAQTATASPSDPRSEPKTDESVPSPPPAQATPGVVGESFLARDLISNRTTRAEVRALQARLDCPSAAFSSGGRFVDCGNGTIRDMNTGLIWLQEATCSDLPGTDADGRAYWQDAMEAAAALKSGMCGLTDDSLPGQWRLPEIGEFCSLASPTPVIELCPAANAVDSLVNTNFRSPTVSNAKGTAKWTTDGDAFIGVETDWYWAATEVEGSPFPIAWRVYLFHGGLDNTNKNTLHSVWPVRGGQ